MFPSTFYLKNIHIIQIECGWEHSLFLTLDGAVHSGGSNKSAQLGHGEKYKENYGSIQKIEYLIKKSIKIINIKCGWNHNLALDENSIAYAWGENIYGKCGVGSEDEYIYIPTFIKTKSNEKIKQIATGYSHSYVTTEKDGYWLFGNNDCNQVTLRDTNEQDGCWLPNNNYSKREIKPYYINNTFKEITNDKEIKKVILGNKCTFIISKPEEQKSDLYKVQQISMKREAKINTKS
eukprot:386644_1